MADKPIDTLFRIGTATGLSDGSLLDRFRTGPADLAEAAFAVVVERHGATVLHVCQNILHDRHDAEDAAQAVFLVLARRARSIRRTESLVGWLYGVAVRVASRARLDAARRRLRERRGAERAIAIRPLTHIDQGGSETWNELYHELDRLPDRFRLPILLCHLEGLTYEQAAQRLGCPVRTVQSRLVRGRARLRDGLTRRGVAPAIAAKTAAFGPRPNSAALSSLWKENTVTMAVRFKSARCEGVLISSRVELMATGATRVMSLLRLLRWSVPLLLLGVVLGGAEMTILARSPSPEPGPSLVTEPDQNRYRVKMGDGASFEVVAISSLPSGPKTWWQPDGTLLEKPPADPVVDAHGSRPQEVLRVVLVKVSDLPKNANMRWLPTFDGNCSGVSPSDGGTPVPGLEAYVVSLRRDRATCEVKVRLASGPWKAEVSNDGSGGVGRFVNGHKFSFGKARPFPRQGRTMTAFAVAHNFFGQDRRLVAIARDGQAHPALSYSTGSDGDEKWVIDLIEGEFDLPPDQVKEYQVQFRPFEFAEIKGIALNPRVTATHDTKTDNPEVETRPKTEPAIKPTLDSDGDGLSDYQEVHKYRTDPRKTSTAGDGVADGDPRRCREFTYSIRSVIKVMPPVNVDCLNDDYQDARVVSRGDNFIELEVVHYPLNINASAVCGNSNWRRDAVSKQAYVRPGITANWDDAMRRDLITALKADGIDPDRLDDRDLVSRVSAWLMANTKYLDHTFCTHYIHYPDGRAAIYPGLEARFEAAKGNPAWTVAEQLEHELFGRAMFARRTRGSCTSSAVLITTVLRALGIPTRMVLGIPMVDGNDPAQMAMVRDGIHHHRSRQAILKGLSGARGYAAHTFNEVFIGGHWVRLNYKTLGQNTLDASYMGLLTQVNTFNDLADIPLAATWGKRYAQAERDPLFRFGNPYRCEEVSDHFGTFAKVENREPRELKSLAISRAYWADDPDAHALIKEAKWLHHMSGSRSLMVHGDDWFDDESGSGYRPFLEAAGKDFRLKADGFPDVKGRVTTSSITWHSRDLVEIEVIISTDEYARMRTGVEYTLSPPEHVAGYEWKTKGRVTLRRDP